MLRITLSAFPFGYYILGQELAHGYLFFLSGQRQAVLFGPPRHLISHDNNFRPILAHLIVTLELKNILLK